MPIELVATIVTALVGAIVTLFWLVFNLQKSQLAELKRQLRDDKAFIKRQERALDVLIGETRKLVDIGKTIIDFGQTQAENNKWLKEVLDRVEAALDKRGASR
jgi:hypothetical protein